MRINRERSGARIRLEDGEAGTLTALITDLTDALGPGVLAVDDPVAQRLFPAGYADADDAAAFRELTETGLRDERLERAAQCVAELAASTPHRRYSDLHLDAEAVERWIKVLNDLRLAIGTRIGVTEDDAYSSPRADSPRAAGWAIYSYLTGVQDSLVRTLLD
jgi:hypothetical protein